MSEPQLLPAPDEGVTTRVAAPVEAAYRAHLERLLDDLLA